MKRKISLALTGLLLATSIAGCGSAQSTGSEDHLPASKRQARSPLLQRVYGHHSLIMMKLPMIWWALT